MPKTRPRPHPVKAVMADRRLTATELSPQVGLNPHTLRRVVNGDIPPWPALRRRMAAALDLPEASLFREDS